MEIKKEGINPKTWRIDGTCPNCKTELSIGYKDINMFAIQRFFGPKLCFTVRCCVCGERLSLPEAKIPSIIRQAILSEMDELDMLIKFFF